MNIGIDLQAANSPSDTIDAAPVENSSYPSQLDAALFYAALGWRLFPVNPINKTPLIRAWQTGASTNPETLDSWWSEWPLAMIGVVCGPLSGIAVVDADNKPDANGVTGMEHWGQLQAQHGKPSAIAAKTPSGGMHIYFSAASLPFKKDERGRIAPKVDFRSATPDGDGIGYVILPPSLNSGGVRYEWLEGASEEALKCLPDAPHWLAMRACFNETERKVIGANSRLLGLIESSPRADWRGCFEAFQKNERTIGEVAREHTTSVSNAELSLDHPYVANAISRAIGQLAGCRDGQNGELNVTAFQLASLLAGAGIKAGPEIDLVKGRLHDAAMRFSVTDPSRPWNSADGRRQAKATIDSGWTAGERHPRDLSQLKQGGPNTGPSTKWLSAVSVDTIQSRPVTWLWPGRIAAGKLSMVAGDPDLGKSQVGIYLAARVTKGHPFHNVPSVVPSEFDRPDPRKPANVILISGEDDPADTIKPRLEAAGADLSRVRLVADVITRDQQTAKETREGFTFQKNLPELRALIESVGDVALVVIDPLSAYLGTTDSHKNSEVRAILTPLASLAAETGVAIVVIAHLNKGGGEKALYRISGSLGFVAAARSVFLVTRDEDTDEEGHIADPARRLFVPIKNNLAPPMAGLVYKLEGATVLDSTGVTFIRTSRVAWSDETTGKSANAALNGTPGADDSKLEQATDFLGAVLADGPRPMREVEDEAEKAGVSWATVRRASAKLRVKVWKPKGAKDASWRWQLPTRESEKAAKVSPNSEVEHLEHLPSHHTQNT